jgi:hypothetical protein
VLQGSVARGQRTGKPEGGEQRETFKVRIRPVREASGYGSRQGRQRMAAAARDSPQRAPGPHPLFKVLGSDLV